MTGKISVFGVGFIGSRFCEMYPDDVIPIKRESSTPKSDDILYLISTTDNYNHLPKDVTTNLWFLSAVLESLTSKNVFNFISSWYIYSKNAELPAKEFADDSGWPTGNYSLTKAFAEELVIQYCQREEIPYRIFRLANVFGKGDKFSKQKNALQYLINEMRHNRDSELYWGGKFYRDYIWIDEVCRMLMDGMIITPVNSIYNVGSGRRILFKDLILLAHRVLGSTSKIRYMESPEFHKKVATKDFYMDTSKINSYGIKVTGSPYEQLVRMILDE